MLTFTDAAAAAIRDLRARQRLPEQGGLRIARAGGDAWLQMSLASTPAEGDQVIEKGDVRIFLEPEAVAMLEDQTLDADLQSPEEPTFRLAG